MRQRQRKLISVVTLFVMVAVMQTYAGVSFASEAFNAITPSPSTQDKQITGILSTQGNKPITVNGASAVSGATIPSGASIETPDGIGATVTIPGHGTVLVAPNTKLTIEIDPSGNLKVTIAQGCAELKTKKGTSGELINPQGAVSKADPSGDNVIDSCPGVKVVGAAVKGGLFGLGVLATVAVIGGGAAAGVTGFELARRGPTVSTFGVNPSPSSP